MPTMDQIMEYAPLLGWGAMAAIVAGVIKVGQATITTKMEAASPALRAVDRSLLLITLPLCILAGFVLPMPEVLEGTMPAYLYWGSTWVGALVGRKKLDVSDGGES